MKVLARICLGVAVFAAGAIASYAVVLRRGQLRWGATDEEVSARLPGDDLIPNPDLTATRAITVHAPADRVWPWIAQLGQGRAGFYTYDALPNVIGADIHSADHLVAEWQEIKVGDEVRLAPQVPLNVAEATANRALVLRGGVPMGETAPPYDFTWAFVIEPQLDGTTRLVVRERYGYTRRWTGVLMEPVEAASFVMTERMLRGIRDRAEAGASSAQVAAVVGA